ncbi:hypothetical protein [Oceanithermus desulfurans]|uniref:Uncharacterized protein n=2 Tax=Oceanithermus desulfurans TaxID=227924 RepID=A0A511RGM6_9DEIN|nr:hypothetical protein [Oceanithermus desulfurans]MBB6030239.1 hypothetical protein [Oceanithermus desulfurans]GEM88798.1 hypothetical protein ODE01S_02320 [Oceanithermus desulfurans NBRC 100063]
MDAKEALIAFLDDPEALALSELAEALEAWPPAAALQKLAARAVFLEDERLDRLLEQACAEARHLLAGLESGSFVPPHEPGA